MSPSRRRPAGWPACRVPGGAGALRSAARTEADASADAAAVAVTARPPVSPGGVRRQPSTPPRRSPPLPGPGTNPSDPGLVAVLAGAGLERAPVTLEFARSFGQIFRVVVSGVMDVLRARQQIKDEFRMRMTQFRAADNNPLKFSAESNT